MDGRRHARAIRREEDRVALQAWSAHRRARLEGEPEAVRAEMLNEARARLERSGRIDWQAGRDEELCRMRVASRLRVKRYGAIPADGREWQRQIAEIRATLGLDPGDPP
ncbi:MAG: hypothetical protein AB7O88_09010 [Reyranellaceae bacterium]